MNNKINEGIKIIAKLAADLQFRAKRLADEHMQWDCSFQEKEDAEEYDRLMSEYAALEAVAEQANEYVSFMTAVDFILEELRSQEG